jgi:hypothetical protein
MTSYYAQFLGLHKEAQTAIGIALAELGESIAGELQRLALPGPNSPSDGTIDSALEPKLKDAARARVQAFFMGESGIPVIDEGETARPNSPFTRVIWPYMMRSAQIATARQRAIIERQFKPYPDVWALYEPFYDKLTGVIVQEMAHRLGGAIVAEIVDTPVIQALPPDRPIATYEPAHKWVKPDGYRLSDRIWMTDDETRRRLDLYISEKIKLGTSAEDLSKGVIQFLKPGQYLPETNKPYGRNLSYNAMRLARTEISAAYAQADIAAARANPLVTQYNVNRTRYGKPCNICDPIANGSPYDIADDSAIPPEHPNCLCSMSFEYQDSIAETVERLRAELRDKHPDLFDANGLMGLADRVRVNTSRWIPGQIAGPDPILIRSALETTATLPAQTVLKTGFEGVFKGDLYYTNANTAAVQAARDGNLPRSKYGSHGWHPDGEGLSSVYREPAPGLNVVRFNTDGLTVANRATLEDLIEQAGVEATKLWGDAPLYSMESHAQFGKLTAEQLERLARERGIDAFMWSESNLHIVAWEKVRYTQAYSLSDLTLLKRGEMVSKPLSVAMADAAGRFSELHEFVELATEETKALRGRRGELTRQYRQVVKGTDQARDAYSAVRAIDPDSPLTHQLYEEYRGKNDRLWEIIEEKRTVNDALKASQSNTYQGIWDKLPGGTRVDIKPAYQRGFKSGKAHAKWEAAVDWVSDIVNGDVYDFSRTMQVHKLANGERAYHLGGNVYLTQSDSISTAIHEIGHALEHWDDYTHQRCVEFLQSRTSPGNIKSLSELTLSKAYDAFEVADPDSFFNPYIGKIYGDWDNPYATEVLSMGLEKLYFSPSQFYRDDPEMFDFIVGLISGWI